MNRKSRGANASSVRNITAGVLLLVSAAACKGDANNAGASGTASDTVGGTLVVALPSDARSLYPPTVDYSLDFAIIAQMYDRLADIGPELNTSGEAGFTPRLAESWTWSPDSLSIAFKLRGDARFHDGVPVRAEDVRFTFRAYTDPTGHSVNNAYLSNIDSISVPDSLTAKVWFKRRTPLQFFDATYHMFILPAHRLASIPIAELGKDSVSAIPVGSGRFRFSSRVPQQSIEMVADTTNYRKRPKVDRVVWAVKSNVQGAALSVFGGDADFFEKLQPEDLDKVPKSPNVKIVPYMQVGYTYLGFNLRSPKDRSKPNPFFADVRVRHALTMAVDRVAGARFVLDTFATPAFGPAPRMMFHNPDSLKQIPFDVAHARALLDSAGWVLEAGKDIRTKDGVPLTFDILVPTTSRPRVAYADLLVQQFRGIGVAATARAVEGSVMGPLMTEHKFDAYIGAWTVTPGIKGITQTWGSRGISSQNYSAYSNPKFDADVDGALNSLNLTTANTLWARAFQQILDDAPAIFLYEDRLIGLMQTRVNPRGMRADAWYADLADWTIDPNKRLPRDRVASGAAR